MDNNDIMKIDDFGKNLGIAMMVSNHARLTLSSKDGNDIDTFYLTKKQGVDVIKHLMKEWNIHKISVGKEYHFE